MTEMSVHKCYNSCWSAQLWSLCCINLMYILTKPSLIQLVIRLQSPGLLLSRIFLLLSLLQLLRAWCAAHCVLVVSCITLYALIFQLLNADRAPHQHSPTCAVDATVYLHCEASNISKVKRHIYNLICSVSIMWLRTRSYSSIIEGSVQEYREDQ